MLNTLENLRQYLLVLAPSKPRAGVILTIEGRVRWSLDGIRSPKLINTVSRAAGSDDVAGALILTRAFIYATIEVTNRKGLQMGKRAPNLPKGD